MLEYHKIQTIWNRDPETNHKTLVRGSWARPEFEALAGCVWRWTEKVDGTNIRVHWDGEAISFGGRTDRAQIPAHLLGRLQEQFLPGNFVPGLPVTLYGEGYGEKIQSGGNYLPGDCGFILFDAQAGDGTWLLRDALQDLAADHIIPLVPVVGCGTLWEAVEYVQSKPYSHIAKRVTPMEGLVMRPPVELSDRQGRRVIGKLKVKDFGKV